jgi:hypothetical protein
MDESKKAREMEEDTGAGLPAATRAGAGTRPEAQAAGARNFGGSSAAAATALAFDKQAVPLFSAEEAQDFRGRWDLIQARFVDEPRQVVEQADSLVAVAMRRLADMFQAERARLEGQWDRGDSVSTEDLRLALQRYRSFFGRILSV